AVGDRSTTINHEPATETRESRLTVLVSGEQERQTVRRPSSSGSHSVFHDKSANLANASKGRGRECSLVDTSLTSSGGRYREGFEGPAGGNPCIIRTGPLSWAR